MHAEVSCGVLTCFFISLLLLLRILWFRPGAAKRYWNWHDNCFAGPARRIYLFRTLFFFFFFSFFCFFLSVRALLLIATIAQVCVHGLREVEHNRIEMELNNSTCGMLQHNNVYIFAFLVYKRASISTPLHTAGPVIERPVYRLQLNGRFKRSTCYIFSTCCCCCLVFGVWCLMFVVCLVRIQPLNRKIIKRPLRKFLVWAEVAFLYRYPASINIILFTLSICYGKTALQISMEEKYMYIFAAYRIDNRSILLLYQIAVVLAFCKG